MRFIQEITRQIIYDKAIKGNRLPSRNMNFFLVTMEERALRGENGKDVA
jgi:hypothetical protein